jgi:hypothetical protein
MVCQVYFLNEGVAQIVDNKLNHKLKVRARALSIRVYCLASQHRARIQVVHTGLRCFESRQEVAKRQQAVAEETNEEGPEHVYRVCQEGVYHVRGMMSKQKLECSRDQFIHLLQKGCTRFEDLKEGGPQQQALVEQIQTMHDGCVVAVCAAVEGDAEVRFLLN